MERCIGGLSIQVVKNKFNSIAEHELTVVISHQF